MISFKYYHGPRLILTILLLATALDYLIVNWVVPIAQDLGISFLRAPSNVALITLFLELNDLYLWKYKPFKWLVKVPDFSGRYEGFVKFDNDKYKGKIPTVMEICQTASKIKVNGYFQNNLDEETYSWSLVEEIRKEEDGFFWIYVLYRNGGNKMDSITDEHEGANVLKYLPVKNGDKAQLKGYYFTNRVPNQTHGMIEAEFTTKEIRGSF